MKWKRHADCGRRFVELLHSTYYWGGVSKFPGGSRAVTGCFDRRKRLMGKGLVVSVDFFLRLVTVFLAPGLPGALGFLRRGGKTAVAQGPNRFLAYSEFVKLHWKHGQLVFLILIGGLLYAQERLPRTPFHIFIEPDRACDVIKGHPTQRHMVPVVFLGSLAEPFGWKHREAKATVEEIVTGLPAGTTTVDLYETNLLGPVQTISAKTRLVFVGYRSGTYAGKVSIDVQGPSFSPEQLPMLLDALRDAALGRLTITGSVHTCGGNRKCGVMLGQRVRLSATNGKDIRMTAVSKQGSYTFRNLTPGTWAIDVVSGGISLPPNRPAGYTVDIRSGCVSQWLEIVEDGGITGIVRGANGRVAAGIPVQLDLSRVGGYRDAGIDMTTRHHFAEVLTDANGRYQFRGLSPGEYLVGINISGEAQEYAWRPTYYPGTGDAAEAAPVRVTGNLVTEGIDMEVPPVRSSVRLWVEAVQGDGAPASNFKIRVEDSFGRKHPGWQFLGTEGSAFNPRPYTVFLGGRYRIFGGNAETGAARTAHAVGAPTAARFLEVVVERDGQDVQVVVDP